MRHLPWSPRVTQLPSWGEKQDGPNFTPHSLHRSPWDRTGPHAAQNSPGFEPVTSRCQRERAFLFSHTLVPAVDMKSSSDFGWGGERKGEVFSI